MKSLKYNYKTDTLTYGGSALHKDDKGIFTVSKSRYGNKTISNKKYIEDAEEVTRIENFIAKIKTGKRFDTHLKKNRYE